MQVNEKLEKAITAVLLLAAVFLWLFGKGYIISAEGSKLCVITAAGYIVIIQTAKEITSVKVNNVRTRTEKYLVECFYKDNPNRPFYVFYFRNEENRNNLVQLIQKRTNNRIAVTAKEDLL